MNATRAVACFATIGVVIVAACVIRSATVPGQLSSQLDAGLAACVAARGGDAALRSTHAILAEAGRYMDGELLDAPSTAIPHLALNLSEQRLAGLDPLTKGQSTAFPPEFVPLLTDPRRGTIGFASLARFRLGPWVTLSSRASMVRLWRRCETLNTVGSTVGSAVGNNGGSTEGELPELGLLLRVIVASLSDACLIDEPGGAHQFGYRVAIETTDVLRDLIESRGLGRAGSLAISGEVSNVLLGWPSDSQLVEPFLLACEVDVRNALAGLAGENDVARGFGCAPPFAVIARLRIDDEALNAAWREIREIRRSANPADSAADVPVVRDRVLTTVRTALIRAAEVRKRLSVLAAASSWIGRGDDSALPAELRARIAGATTIRQTDSGEVVVSARDLSVQFGARVRRP